MPSIFDEIAAEEQSAPAGGSIWEQIAAEQGASSGGIFDRIAAEMGQPESVATPAVSEPEPPPSTWDKAKKETAIAGKWAGKYAVDQAKATGETAMSLASGMILWPVSKAYGLMALPFGRPAMDAAEEHIASLGYQPYTKEAQAANELIGKGFEWFLKPAHQAEKEVSKLSPRAGYLVGLGVELAEFAMTGGIVKGAKAKLKPKGMPKAEAIKPKVPENFEYPELDRTRTNAEALAKTDDLTTDFILRDKEPHQGVPPIIEGKPIVGEQAVTTPKEPILKESRGLAEHKAELATPEIVEPAGPNFLERATERLGGKAEPKRNIFDEVEAEYGEKITDRTVPQSPKQKANAQKAKAIQEVGAVTKDGKSAKESAELFDKELFSERQDKLKADIKAESEQPKTPPQTPKAPLEATQPETPVKGMPKGEIVEGVKETKGVDSLIDPKLLKNVEKEKAHRTALEKIEAGDGEAINTGAINFIGRIKAVDGKVRLYSQSIKNASPEAINATPYTEYKSLKDLAYEKEYGKWKKVQHAKKDYQRAHDTIESDLAKQAAEGVKEKPKQSAKESWEMTRDEYVKKEAVEDIELRKSMMGKEGSGVGSGLEFNIKAEHKIKRNKTLLGKSKKALKTGRDVEFEGLHRGAIKQALSENKSVPEKVLKDYPELSKKPKDADIKITGKKNKTVKVDIPKKEAEGLKPKEQKAYLLEEIDAAIERSAKSVEEGNNLKPGGGKELMKTGEFHDAEFYTFKVPGDGEFHVAGSELLNFKKKVKSQFPVTPGGVRPKAKKEIKPTGKRLTDYDGHYYNEFKPRKEGLIEKKPDYKGDPPEQYFGDGYFSDGSYLVKTTTKPKTKHPVETKNTRNLKAATKGENLKPAEMAAEAYEAEWDITLDKNGNAAGKTNIGKPYVHVVSEGGGHVLLDAKYVDSVLTLHPKAKPFMGDIKGGVFFKKGNSIVGRIMPFGPYRTLKSLPKTMQKGYKKRYGQQTTSGKSEKLAARTPVDIAKDINTALGNKGKVGDMELTPEQAAAYKRLAKDVDAIKRNAKRVGKDVEQYLKDLKYDPEVVKAIVQEGEKIKKVSETVKAPPVEIKREKTGVVKEEIEIIKDARELRKDFKLKADELLGVISTRLKNIHPSIKYNLRNMEYTTLQSTMKDLTVAERYLKQIKELPKAEQKAYDLARKNANVEGLARIERQYKLKGKAAAIRKVLDGLHERAKNVGLDMPYLENHHPRMVKDYKGLLKYFGKHEQRGVIRQAIKEKETAIRREMTKEEKAEYINTLIRGYGDKLSLSTNHAKSRKIELVTTDLNKYYHSSDAALVAYVNRLNGLIEARRFFGQVPTQIKKLKSIEKRVRGRLAKLESRRGKLTRRENADYFILKNRLEKLSDTIRDLSESDMDASIGGYVLKLLAERKIKPEQEMELTDILRARFNAKGARGVVGFYRDVSYIDTMGSVISAVTQIGDIAFSLHKNGFYYTGKALPRAIAKKSRISKQELIGDKIAEEFSSPTRSARALNEVFKRTGLEKIDTIGKEVLVNGALEKFEAMARNPNRRVELLEELLPIFEKETGQVIKDLQKGEITQNVKLLTFNELLDVQPLALSEMPQKYLTAGNGRIFYMLKTYQLKLLDVARNDIIQEINKPDLASKKRGLKNLVKLTTALVLCNATADEIKDFMLNRETSFSDKVTDNLLRIVGLSKYTIWQGRREGIGTALMKLILPPAKFINSAWKDLNTLVKEPEKLKEGVEVTGSIPIVGKMYYWWFGKGTTKNKSRESSNETSNESSRTPRSTARETR
ncbi:MAG: hypothetical protein GY845_30335 [Planctomycetes bacterium]|nr:hypothetical protein [Planctomycetota bacterium]